EMSDSTVKFKRLMRDLMDYAQVALQKVVDDSLRNEQYQDKKSPKWQGRKNDDEAGDARTNRRALLVKAGNLIRSVEVEQTKDSIVIRTDSEDAQVHNEGLTTGKGRRTKMPKRQFMPIPGEASPIDDKVEKWYDGEMDKIFK